MKIQCQSCQAKYTIADDKVLGKVVKIRCKKCSSTIVINGNESRAAAEDNADTQLFDYAGQAGEQWTVNVADGDQRTMTAIEIANEYRAGVINDETYCWKDDMADWLPLREIEALYGAVKLGRQPAHSLHDEHVAPAPQSVAPAPLFSAGGGSDTSPFAPQGGGNLFGGAAAEAPAPAAAAAAARRGGGRGQGADLFGNAGRAGGDEDVTTSAARGGGGGAGGGLESNDKLTGQRNENSVLFSLSALTDGAKKDTAPVNKTTATSDGSGLIDIRALSANMGADDKKDTSARVDDIMNLSGGGAFGAALTAPILAPPPLEVADPGQAAAGNKSNTMLFAIIGGFAVLGIIIALAIVFSSGKNSQSATKDPTETNPGGSASVAAVTPPPVDTNAAPTPTAPVADNTPPPPGTGVANAGSKPIVGAAGKPATGGAAAKPADKPAEAAKPAEAPKPEAPKDFGSALAAAAGKPADAPKATGGGGSSAPFDRGAAAAALGNVNVQSCKKADGPTGSGHVKVTFEPNGSVSTAIVDSGPYPGTPVGGCIAGKYRAAHIPAFSGAAVSVGKSFTIN